MKRHERAFGGTPSKSLTDRIQTRKALTMHSEPGDLSVIEAVQRIIALHNEDPGERGGYILYNPFTPKRFEGRREVADYPEVGYVAVAAGTEIKRTTAHVEVLMREVEQARRERRDPDSGHIFVQ